MGERWDVVVVGAGSAGCALAARLVDAGRRVLLLEAGADHARPEDFPAAVRDAATMGAAVPGHPANWDLVGELTGELRWPVPRGRVVGGSSALNGTYFVRGTPADFDGWAAAGNDLWSHDRVLPAFARSEADAAYGDRPGHGAHGPVPVTRSTRPHPVTDAFAAACDELGFPEEPDKNAGGPPGHGPLPVNVVDGVRVNAAMAYLSPRRGRPGLTVRGDTPVTRVVVERGRAVGVQTAAGVVHADEVVLAAGAVGSPHLLMLSGIGPAAQLRTAGVPVLVDLPGVGAEFSDHPDLYVTWRPARRTPMPRGLLPLASALNTAAAGSRADGDLEVMPWLKPFSRVMLSRATGSPLSGVADVLRRPGPALRALRRSSSSRLLDQARRRDDLYLGLALQQEDSRGLISLVSADPAVQPRIEYRYLTEESDRRRMREGVRLCAELLRTAAFAPLVAERTGLADTELDDDRALDRWVRHHLATAVHLAGSARMGPESDPGAVVDQHLRVRGVTGLRVVDTSVMPRVTSRGPAATAVMLGERAAELMAGAG
ncbi:mycofactocin system GMC family oxidoreductase MftG [Modestobacter sp. I12A-02628]|uniref:FAD-dependent oxidoreductase n=1 Tax=Goekera deserti TaxID=2497753 RepID=A0A7K3WAE4_9ACTN|nr:GMC family oxidoreductase N-terminal domain-containing protein [Goekera deserti]MPQ98689.1 mycofactocin system GMC family oxidoreductase MftG [Goekera deserti]NDI49251.1 FAD-dependent oxidoreductase [Goekera deserti]NEL52989.1 FAD-dependent oxidoreductase [Goekera deserti]